MDIYSYNMTKFMIKINLLISSVHLKNILYGYIVYVLPFYLQVKSNAYLHQRELTPGLRLLNLLYDINIQYTDRL